MELVESLNIKEKAYIEKLENGMTVIIVPKQNTKKKYVIWGTHFGSIDNRFIMPGSKEEVFVPDGVAHYLEHKMFEQPNGTNSLDTLMALGIDANAYTTNDHTAYLFECTNNFEEALTELMDYVQHPFFTDENVEKERGIIGQEIMMYDDDPGWRLYMNAMDCLYKENAIKIDIAGSIESISHIDKEVLYKCYNTFYHPSNMVFVVCGDVEPKTMLKNIKSKLLKRENQAEIKRIYPKSEDKINKKYKEQEMEVSTPLFMIGFRDINKEKDIVKKHIAIEILLNMIIGKSSKLYKELYEEGNLIGEPDMDYEFANDYAHVLISGQSKNPERIEQGIKDIIKEYNENLDEKHFERIKKKVYGDFVSEYNSVSNIARMFLTDFFKGINPFDYIEEYNAVTLEYAKGILKDIFDEKNMVLSVVKEK